MRRLVPFLTLFSCLSFPHLHALAYEPTVISNAVPSAPDAPWGKLGSPLTDADLKILLAQADASPPAKRVLARVQKTLRIKTPEAWRAYVTLCDPVQIDSAYRGYTHLVVRRLTHLQSVEGIVRDWPLSTEADFIPDLHEREVIADFRATPDYVEVKTLWRKGICIRAGQSVRDAFFTFMHELAHLERQTYSGNAFVSQYADAGAYVETTIESPGNELDAHLQQYQIQMSLDPTGGTLPAAVRDAFDSQGALIDRARLLRFILEDQRYRETLQAEYAAKLKSLAADLRSREAKLLVPLYNQRVEYLQQSGLPSDDRALVEASMVRLRTELEAVRAERKRLAIRMATENSAP